MSSPSMTGPAFLSSLMPSREIPGPIAIGLAIGILSRSRPARPPNTPVTAHELSPEKSAELAAWARTVGIDVDPKANELEQWPKVIMGFVSKGIEVADQLLIEADRDPTPRGQQMRKEGLAIIDSFIRLVPMSPPAGEGFNLWTGKADSWAGDTVTLRGPSEGMRTLLDAYRREKRHGREHPDWLHWCAAVRRLAADAAAGRRLLPQELARWHGRSAGGLRNQQL